MNTKIVPVAVGLVAAVVGFVGGMKYGESKVLGNPASLSADQRQALMQGFRNGGGGGGTVMRRTGGGGAFVAGANRGNFLNGEILNKDATSITVKSQDGGSKIVFYSASTTIGKTTSGAADDLANGQYVMVSGNSNSDGTISAQSIQIRPAPPTMDVTTTNK